LCDEGDRGEEQQGGGEGHELHADRVHLRSEKL
jgi:hypothetical protein